MTPKALCHVAREARPAPPIPFPLPFLLRFGIPVSSSVSSYSSGWVPVRFGLSFNRSCWQILISNIDAIPFYKFA